MKINRSIFVSACLLSLSLGNTVHAMFDPDKAERGIARKAPGVQAELVDPPAAAAAASPANEQKDNGAAQASQQQGDAGSAAAPASAKKREKDEGGAAVNDMEFPENPLKVFDEPVWKNHWDKFFQKHRGLKKSITEEFPKKLQDQRRLLPHKPLNLMSVAVWTLYSVLHEEVTSSALALGNLWRLKVRRLSDVLNAKEIGLEERLNEQILDLYIYLMSLEATNAIEFPETLVTKNILEKITEKRKKFITFLVCQDDGSGDLLKNLIGVEMKK
jgi:hypothetical protein